MVLAFKEDGKSFDELSTKITLKNNAVENIKLDDGTLLDLNALQAATDGDDLLVYGNTPTTIDALGGDDTVVTGSGNDRITGGSGDDNLQGGLGDDTYIFNLGDGNDVIDDSYRYGYKNTNTRYAGEDTIVFGEGITKEDLEVTIVGSDVVISIKNTTDSITIKNATDPNSAVENIKLNDGTLLKVQELQGATDTDDVLLFGNTPTNIDALGGNDTVTTGSGDDTISGGSGNDTLNTNDGADTLYGNAGND